MVAASVLTIVCQHRPRIARFLRFSESSSRTTGSTPRATSGTWMRRQSFLDTFGTIECASQAAADAFCSINQRNPVSLTALTAQLSEAQVCCHVALNSLTPRYLPRSVRPRSLDSLSSMAKSTLPRRMRTVAAICLCPITIHVVLLQVQDGSDLRHRSAERSGCVGAGSAADRSRA